MNKLEEIVKVRKTRTASETLALEKSLRNMSYEDLDETLKHISTRLESIGTRMDSLNKVFAEY